MAITAADGRPLPFTSLGGGLPILPSRSNNRDGGHKAMAEPAPSVHYDGAKSPFSPLPTITKSQAVEAVQDIAFGSAAGIVGKIIEYPFDTIKVRLQSQPTTGGVPLYTGPLDCARQAIRTAGALSLYRGVSAPLLGAAIETSSLFVTYRLAQRTLERFGLAHKGKDGKLTLGALVACGAMSGGATSLLLTPIELVKCQMQAPPGPIQEGHLATPRSSPLAVCTAVWRHRGILGFWRGQLGTLIRETGGSAAWFGSYESVCAFFRQRQFVQLNGGTSAATSEVDKSVSLPVWQQLLAGATAGVSYNFICYPADTIKSRMQTEEVCASGPGRPRPTFWSVGRTLWRQQGLRGMYQGCGITVARAAPSSAFIFVVYERLKSRFG